VCRTPGIAYIYAYIYAYLGCQHQGPPRPAHCSRAVWRSLRGPPGWCSSVRARSAPVGASANVGPGSSRSRMRHATQSGVPPFLSLFSSPTPQADRGVCGHTISRWPCTGLLMIGESVAGLSRRLRVSFGVESRPPPGPPNCVFLSEKLTIHNLPSPRRRSPEIRRKQNMYLGAPKICIRICI